MDRIGHTTDSVCLLFALGRPPPVGYTPHLIPPLNL